ncbi:hypothetical protein GGQ80_001638 [Sphingomonas jinjuensis]|uniref:17 kDa surface antigen n=1 Tax=Sphingomonas jinjuensis TaxID=535907 RepID=A0A840FAS3_9SPHN|nr:glycine zipper 2TM domain-containing protein [Sphingomonas jinjuensis]MBB4153732.1 hypothetical protein [Sphingomonas jinjuensis]
MKLCILVAAGAMIGSMALATPTLAQSSVDDARFQQAQARFDREYQLYRQEADRYRALRGAAYDNGRYRQAPDPYGDDRESGYYDPSRDYRAGNYQERVLSTNDRVYAGTDGRYYCRRSDGTTGLIVGAAGGGILGNVIDGGRSRTVGTLLGAAVGGLAGRSVDQNQVRCR